MMPVALDRRADACLLLSSGVFSGSADVLFEHGLFCIGRRCLVCFFSFFLLCFLRMVAGFCESECVGMSAEC